MTLDPKNASIQGPLDLLMTIVADPCIYPSLHKLTLVPIPPFCYFERVPNMYKWPVCALYARWCQRGVTSFFPYGSFPRAHVGLFQCHPGGMICARCLEFESTKTSSVHQESRILHLAVQDCALTNDNDYVNEWHIQMQWPDQ